MTRIHGGKAVYGAQIGILMLETRFPRIPGDIGNAATFPFPVHYRVVRGATPDRAVRQDPRDMADLFVEAGRDLVALGCDGIVTNCGFLSLIQSDLKAALGVPVAASSLMQVPMAARTLPDRRRPGILTISRGNLTDDHLRAAGVPPDTPVEGTDAGREFTRAILGDEAELDLDACRIDLLEAAHRLVEAHDGIGAIVLECTNMVPWARDIRRATGLPVWSVATLVSWFHAALAPPAWTPELYDPRVGQ